jgi:hypothetical protein
VPFNVTTPVAPPLNPPNVAAVAENSRFPSAVTDADTGTDAAAPTESVA